MFKVGDLVVPSDGWLGKAIVDAYKGEHITFPARVERVTSTSGVQITGDRSLRNPDCFKLCDDGPW